MDELPWPFMRSIFRFSTIVLDQSLIQVFGKSLIKTFIYLTLQYVNEEGHKQKTPELLQGSGADRTGLKAMHCSALIFTDLTVFQSLIDLYLCISVHKRVKKSVICCTICCTN